MYFKTVHKTLDLHSFARCKIYESTSNVCSLAHNEILLTLCVVDSIISFFWFVAREAPIISIQRQIVEGEIFQANCTIKYSCPVLPPSIHWNKSQFRTNTTLKDFKQEALGQWLYRETLYVLATYEMHNSKMWCSAQFRTYTTESQQITLNILRKWNSLPAQNTLYNKRHTANLIF